MRSPASATASQPPVELGAPPTLAQIFTAFSKISLTSFGGGLSGWMLREFVQRRRWLSEDQFLSGLSLAQAFPGVNVVNLAIWIGYQLRGSRGALVGALGMVVPAMLVAIMVAAAFGEIAHAPLAHRVLAGVAAAAVGLSLQMGIRAAYRAAYGAAPIVIMVITFGGIFLAQLPLLWVVGAMAPLSILLAWLRLRREGQAAAMAHAGAGAGSATGADGGARADVDAETRP
ncbi:MULTISPECIES: chromate transporter [unclassified Achromobacter]|uniref:chromate transporter n=1 Tax=unclassified Achromobacter TaxID=2626865 RepID=UPI0018E9858F|nr:MULTISPECIES: chromate transporter [unclassified Achromobacter]